MTCNLASSNTFKQNSQDSIKESYNSYSFVSSPFTTSSSIIASSSITASVAVAESNHFNFGREFAAAFVKKASVISSRNITFVIVIVVITSFDWVSSTKKAGSYFTGSYLTACSTFIPGSWFTLVIKVDFIDYYVLLEY